MSVAGEGVVHASAVEISSGAALGEPLIPAWHALADPAHFWFRWRLRAALAQLDDLGFSRERALAALEVGCGSGALTRQLHDATAWTVDGADVDLEALSAAPPSRGRRMGYDVRSRRADLHEAYDVVIAFDVLEHVAEPREFLAAALAHLRHGGLLWLNVPALPQLTSGYDRAVGHLRRYTAASLAAELQGLGVEVRDVRYWGLTLVPLLALRWVLTRNRAPDADTVRLGFAEGGAIRRALLRGLMELETRLTLRPPLGTSVLLVATKVGAEARTAATPRAV